MHELTAQEQNLLDHIREAIHDELHPKPAPESGPTQDESKGGRRASIFKKPKADSK